MVEQPRPGLGQERRVAHRLSDRHAELCRDRAERVDLQGRALQRSRAADHRLRLEALIVSAAPESWPAIAEMPRESRGPMRAMRPHCPFCRHAGLPALRHLPAWQLHQIVISHSYNPLTSTRIILSACPSVIAP